MKFDTDTPRKTRTIGGTRKPDAKFAPGTEVEFEVQVPAPYTPGSRELTEGEAAILNQTIAENLSNNLRAKLLAGKTEGEGDAATTREFTAEEAQAMVDAYLAEYEPGVRAQGSGEPRVTDPVEREARGIARDKAKEMVAAAGLKVGDVNLPEITNSIFEKNRDALMAAGKKIVEAARKAAGGAELDLGVDLTPKAKPAAAETPTPEPVEA